jgi:hypothetical protein|tara:strand:- start:346 stop:861 length:516 start_codon:yes stop_codon:yes gene_type:complete
MANINKIYQESNVTGGQSREEIDAINKMKAEERDRRRRLSAFMRQQRRADEDGFFSAEEQQAAREEFARIEEQQQSDEERKKLFDTLFDIKKPEHTSELDAAKRLIPVSTIDADKVVGTDSEKRLLFKDPLPDGPYVAEDDGKVLQIVDINEGNALLAADYQFKKQFLKWV